MIPKLLLILFCSFFVGLAHAQATFVVVAANMKDAFIEIQNQFQKENKGELKVIYGSSGNFASQIMNGAPFHLFISADEQYPLELFKKGKTVNEGTVYAIGKLALIANKGKGITLDDSKDKTADAIKRANKIALAKPELAPYGRASVEYLKASNLWELANSKIVYADNIAMAAMFVTTGSADIGFTALSIAKSPSVAKQISSIELTDGYQPIKQRMVLIKNPTPDAIRLYEFMQSPKTKEILRSFGYQTP
ncbi:molybdate ABC transporter substrate-binding protein [Polynucleobacter acidiphobus]|uniref:molybdate ABC transporter substrate-binding protein n=1 Tax=Polynucleobacter acidiphobus TaxID=556053 RepID=UPI000D3BDCB7|nr:molybdate ABC transporter substrate-binding protein [Polynucleobacter acidiphobus]